MIISTPSTGRSESHPAQRLAAAIGIALLTVPLAMATPAQARTAVATESTKVSHKSKEYRATKMAIGKTQVGLASWYGKKFNKRKTASGEKFSPNLPTAAHRHLPLGTHVRVTNLENGRTTTVRVNDRGPYVKGRIIDLSKSAAKKIGMVHVGVTPVKIEVVGHDKLGTPAEKNASVEKAASTQRTASTRPNPASGAPMEMADSGDDGLSQVGAGDHVEEGPDGAAGSSLAMGYRAEIPAR